jgi:hypothetical protein
LLDSAVRGFLTSANSGTRREVVSRTLESGNYYLRVFSDRPVATAYSLSFKTAAAAAPAAAPRPAMNLFSRTALRNLFAA